jgi:ATP-dependent DNA ligase
MELPVNPPILPMLAKRVDQLPTAGEWIFEPKWDGFRALIFRDGKEVMIQSRDEKPLNRYFPELIDPLLKQLPARCVLDGEVVVAQKGALDFDSLQLRESNYSQNRFPHPSSSSICFAKVRKTCATSLSQNVASGSSLCSLPRSRPCT